VNLTLTHEGSTRGPIHSHQRLEYEHCVLDQVFIVTAMMGFGQWLEETRRVEAEAEARVRQVMEEEERRREDEEQRRWGTMLSSLH
jgi:hypothetical protein